MAEQVCESYFPFSSGAGKDALESLWHNMARYWLLSGVIMQWQSGFSGQCAVTQNSGDVRIGPGIGWIQGHYGAVTANHDHTPTAADATNPRYDRAVLRLDMTNKKVVSDLKAGTPAASPTPPVLQTDATIWEISLAVVRVAAVTGTLTIIDAREWALGMGDLPVGIVLPSAFAGAPSQDPRFLMPFGQNVSRFTYARLFARMSTTFGVGDGSTTFGLPDYRGRAHFGSDNLGTGIIADAGRLSVSNAIGTAGGEENHLLVGPEVAGHTHSGTTGLESVNHTHAAPVGSGGWMVEDTDTGGPWSLVRVDTGFAAFDARRATWSGNVASAGQSADHVHAFTSGDIDGTHNAAHNNMPPYMLGGWLLKAH